MQHWEILIILVIAFGVWILSTIFKGDEGDKTKRPQRRPEGGRLPRRPSAPPPPDRGIDSSGRRRDMPAGMESRPEQTRRAPQPIVTRGPAGQRKRAPILATIIDEPSKPIIRQAAVVELRPEPLPVPLPPPVALPPAPPAPPTPTRERAASPVVQEVLRLLRSPKTAAVAFVVREILDRPTWPRRR